jgi:hypothetical protein
MQAVKSRTSLSLPSRAPERGLLKLGTHWRWCRRRSVRARATRGAGGGALVPHDRWLHQRLGERIERAGRHVRVHI